MQERKEKNNKVRLVGEVVSDLVVSHERTINECYYRFNLAVKRLSDTIDVIPVLVPCKQHLLSKIKVGNKIKIIGEFRSYNFHDGKKSKLILNVFTRKIDTMPKDAEDINHIELDGVICKDVIYRKTPLGKKISDIILAVNRLYDKSDYIPCIAWERNAEKTSLLEVGTEIKIHGRIQSRKYEKKISDEQVEERIAYEVSIQKFEVVE